MNTFWRLYKKEFRFLLAPGIGMIVLGLIRVLLHFNHPRGDEHAYIFGALLLYSLIYEHLAKSSHQYSMLPVHRSVRIAAKYFAVVSWGIIYIIQMFIYVGILGILSRFIPAIQGQGWPNIDVVVMYFSSTISSLLMICALFALGYAAALTFRPLKYIIGPATVITGYLSLSTIRSYVRMFLKEFFPPIETSVRAYVNSRIEISIWQQSISYLLAAIIFITVSMFLFARYREV